MTSGLDAGEAAARVEEGTPPERLGQYVVLGELGRGGMGTVYRARHETTGEEAAVKVLPPELGRAPGFRDRFRREVMALGALSHPNIVALLDVGEQDGTPWYAMEFVPGRSLGAEVLARARLPWAEAIDIGVQICHALKHAHDRGVVHRDLKLSNLILTPEGQVKLTDFGIARVFDDPKLTAVGGVIGTADFMSPEQAEGKPAGRRSDLYSLGIVLYALVAGRLPFRSQSALDLMRQHRYGRFDRPGLIVTGLPADLDCLIVDLMAKDPTRRPADAHVTARRLDSVRRRAAYRAEVEIEEGSDGPPRLDRLTPALEVSTGEVDIPAPATRPTVASDPAGLDSRMPPTGLRDDGGPASRSRFSIGRERLGAVLVAVLMGLVAAGLVRNLLPESDRALAARGDQLMASGTVEDDSAARDRAFGPLLERHGSGPWADLARRRLAELAGRARARSARAGMRPGLRPIAAPAEMSEAERLYLRADALLQAGDLAAARARFSALATAFEGDPWATVASGRVIELDRRPPSAAQKRRELLDGARRLAEAGKREEARALWRAFVTLYADDPEARQEVEAARTQLGNSGGR